MSEFTVTGSDVYASVSCLRKIALRWSGDRERMRETRPHEEFLLKRRGFHWINEYPFNRY